PIGQCNTGPVQCCNQVVPASNAAAQGTLGLIGVVLQDINIPVGLDCSPITIIGGGNGACQSNPVCCNDNSNGGLISIGCIPISI
ncbi:fungal hydrophobin, partial [Marasmius fiardii PR-910]